MKLYESLRSRLETQHFTIHHVIDGLSRDRLMLQPAAGKWSIHANIAHLARYQQVFLERLSLILSSDNLYFNRYSAATDDLFPSFIQSPTLQNQQLINENRAVIIGLILSLRPVQLERFATHPKFGLMNIPQWTEFFLLHEAHHIYTIFQLIHQARN